MSDEEKEVQESEGTEQESSKEQTETFADKVLSNVSESLNSEESSDAGEDSKKEEQSEGSEESNQDSKKTEDTKDSVPDEKEIKKSFYYQRKLDKTMKELESLKKDISEIKSSKHIKDETESLYENDDNEQNKSVPNELKERLDKLERMEDERFASNIHSMTESTILDFVKEYPFLEDFFKTDDDGEMSVEAMGLYDRLNDTDERMFTPENIKTILRDTFWNQVIDFKIKEAQKETSKKKSSAYKGKGFNQSSPKRKNTSSNGSSKDSFVQKVLERVSSYE